MVTPRIKILNDFAFKKAFGEKGDEPQLLAFLNSVLERTGKGKLESVEIVENKELPADVLGGKMSRLDVLGKLVDGTIVNVEVQIKNEADYEKRSLYYWAKKYTSQIIAGNDYTALVPVIAINIVDFNLFDVTDFHTSFHLWEDRNKELLYSDVCEIHFLDMVKFRSIRELDLTNPLHRWLVYFNEYSPPDLIEEVIKMDVAINMVNKRLEEISRDPEMQRAYIQYEKTINDEISNINAAMRKGEAKGKSEGEYNKSIEVASRMKHRGYDKNEISDMTGLPLDVIERL
jgi:predicted transposase/invertase (TIGR01784 family)